MATASRADVPHTMTGVIYGVITVLIWAAFPIFTKISLDQSLTPVDVSSVRYLTAGALLLPFLLRKGLQGLPPLALLVIVCGAGAPYLITASYGLKLSSASHFGLVTPSCMLLFTTLGSIWLQGERLTANRFLGIGLVLSGLLLVALDSLTSSEASLEGDLLFVLAGFLWASYTLALRQWSIEPLHATALVSACSMMLCLPLMLLGSGSQLASMPWHLLGLHALYQGAFSAIIALVFYSKAVGLLGPSKGAVFGALVPGMALMLAVLFLDEPATYYQYLGVVIIFLGVMVTLEMLKFIKSPST